MKKPAIEVEAAAAKATNGSLTAKELADRWGNSPSLKTINNWRAMVPQRGPAFQRLGRSVRYPLESVIEYEKASRIQPSGPRA